MRERMVIISGDVEIIATQELELLEAEIDELRRDRDFWQGEFMELLECIGGKDPRHE